MGKNVIDEIWEHAMEEGSLKTLHSLAHDGLISVKDAAARAAMTENDFTTKMQKTGY